MLYREIIAVCSHLHINTLCGQNVELHLKTQSVPRSKHTPSRLQKQSVAGVQGNNRCLFCYLYRTHKCICWSCSILIHLIGATWWHGWDTALQAGRSLVRFPMVSHWHNPSGHTMALVSTQPLNRNEYHDNLLGSKGGRCLGLTTLPPSCADCPEMWESQGLFRPSKGLFYVPS